MNRSLFSTGSLFATGVLAIFLLCGNCAAAQFVRGADIGWLQQMEATGYKFYDSAGVQQDCLDILKSKGINAVRLRVWVNPSDDKVSGHCSKKEVAAMALRAKNMGMRIMIDFHYSDSWADPGKQNKPAAWAGHPFSQLLADLYDHTFEVLDTLKSIGARPDWAQIGNEITGGILWPDGSTSNWPQLAQLLNKGYDAVKAVDSSIRVIIHLDQGNNNSRFRTFFDQAKNLGVRYDIIGMSYYPYWLGSDYMLTINNLGNNMNDMVSRYGKDVMVVEIGGDYLKAQNTYDMLVAVIGKTQAVPGNRGLGVIYWEPEGEKSWSGYQLSCWGADGKPTKALDAFLTGSFGINTPDVPGLEIYPNPYYGGLLNINLSSIRGSSVLTIFDEACRPVRELVLNNQSKVSLDADFPRGMYIISLNNRGRSIMTKLMVN